MLGINFGELILTLLLLVLVIALIGGVAYVISSAVFKARAKHALVPPKVNSDRE